MGKSDAYQTLTNHDKQEPCVISWCILQMNRYALHQHNFFKSQSQIWSVFSMLMVFYNVPVSAPWIFCPPNKPVYIVSSLLLLERDFVDSSCSGNVANDCAASVKDEMKKNLGAGIQCLHNITNSTNYMTEWIEWLFNLLASEHILLRFMNTSFLKKIALSWIPQKTFHDKSMLIQAMLSCRKATSDYLSKCWRRSMSSNCVAMPQ